MVQVDFYHLQKQSIDEVLPRLLNKAYETKTRIKIKTIDDKKVDYYDSYLWTFDESSFIPHGSKKDGFVEEQTIFIGCDDENPNHAEFLFLLDGADISNEIIASYNRVFYMFNGKNNHELEVAREKWKTYKENGFDIRYWQQNDNGNWQQRG